MLKQLICWLKTRHKDKYKVSGLLQQLKYYCNEMIWDTASKVPSRAAPTLETQFEMGRRKAALDILKKIDQLESIFKRKDKL